MKLRPDDMFGPASDPFDPAVPGSGCDRELVVWIDEASDLVALLHITRDRMPRLAPLSGIMAAVACGNILFENSTRILPRWLNRELDEDDRRFRDERMKVIEPLVTKVPAIFDPRQRGRLIGERHRETGRAINSIKHWLELYFRHGRCANALLDQYHRCGRRRTDGEGGWAKLGRKPSLPGGVAHENRTALIEEEFGIAVKRERLAAGEAFTIAAAHKRWRNEFCYDSVEIDGRRFTSLKARYADVEPASYEQFRLWYHESGQAETTARKILTEPVYEKDNRAISSTSTAETSGPGSRIQIDASEVNFALSSTLNRRNLVGRPWVYFVRDVWSRYILGYYLGFQPPSMIAASLALMCAFSTKEALLRRFGFDPEVDIWLPGFVGGALLHDGGELTSHQGDWLVGRLAMTFEQTASDRGDLKGAVETLFQWSDVEWASTVPGRRPSPRYRGRRRTQEDIDLAAQGKLNTVAEFERKLIQFILRWNNRHVLTGYDPDRDMMAAGVNRIPHEMLEWGVVNRGAPRRFPDEEVRFMLMPRVAAKVYPDGIHFGGVSYTCPQLQPLQAEAARTNRTVPVDISHDFTGEKILWHNAASASGYFECTRSDGFRWVKGLRLEEISAEVDARNAREGEKQKEERLHEAEVAAQMRAEDAARSRQEGGSLTMTRSEAKKAKTAARASAREQELGEKFRGPAVEGETISTPAPAGPVVVPFLPRRTRSYAPPSLEDVEDASV